MLLNEASQRKLIANTLVGASLVIIIGIVLYLFLTHIPPALLTFRTTPPTSTPTPSVDIPAFKPIATTATPTQKVLVTLTPTQTIHINSTPVVTGTPTPQLWQNGQTINDGYTGETILLRVGQIININLSTEYSGIKFANPNVLAQVSKSNDVYAQGTYQAVHVGSTKLTADALGCQSTNLDCQSFSMTITISN